MENLIKNKFNEEVVWDNDRTLFDKYFKEKIVEQRHVISYIKTDKTDFNEAIKNIIIQYKNM